MTHSLELSHRSQKVEHQESVKYLLSLGLAMIGLLTALLLPAQDQDFHTIPPMPKPSETLTIPDSHNNLEKYPFNGTAVGIPTPDFSSTP